MPEDVSKFFDRHVDEYYEDPASHPMAPFHRQTARRLEESLAGSVLCIGGLWDLADVTGLCCAITVTDVSRGMVTHYDHPILTRVVSDGRSLAFQNATFDHVVLPLVLHHISGPSAWSARESVRCVLREAARVLKPGGRVWISELCPSQPVYLAELAAAPLTRALLASARIPFVVMHSPRFYRRVLEQLGFKEVTVSRVRSKEAKATDWLEPVIGLSWLRVPRFMFPVNATVICGQR